MSVVAVDRPLARRPARELYTRGFLYLVRDRFSGTTLVAQRLKLVAERLSAGASHDDSVSASQMYEHAADRVQGLLKHRWHVDRLHLDDTALVDKVEALRRTGSVVFLGDSIAYSFA
jgi:hypothetical protein|mmetsp:Transcript_61340/g.168474  ORF Transcript_61340/g.168474 Transcript_61340/m.168474 type:complete len:117 (+) Transcript_61340:330-680(+)